MPVQSRPETELRTVKIEIDAAVVWGLRGEALRRDVPVARLIHDLLDVIAADKLTAAILDD